MSARFKLAPEAEAQIGDVVDFIAANNESAATRVRDALYEAFALLAENPGIGHVREDLTHRPLKFWSVYSYVVAYEPRSTPINIIASMHGARDVERLLKD